MRTEHAREFAVLADTLSYFEAAERLGISTSALSKHVKALEAELGATLLKRTSRRVELTDEGHAFVAYTAAIASAEGELRDAIGDIAQGRENTLVVGSTYRAVDLVSAFRRRRRHVALRTAEAPDGAQLASAVADGRVDVALVLADGDIDADGVLCEHLLSDELVAVVPEGHRLASRDAVTLADLADEDLVTLGADTPDTRFLLARFREAGLSPTVALEVDRGSTAVRDVADGLGVAALMRGPASRLGARGVALVPIAPPLTRDLVALLPERPKGLAEEFVALARRMLAGDPT